MCEALAFYSMLRGETTSPATDGGLVVTLVHVVLQPNLKLNRTVMKHKDQIEIHFVAEQ